MKIEKQEFEKKKKENKKVLGVIFSRTIGRNS